MTFNPDFAVILVYLLVLLCVGYWSSRRVKDSRDYIIAAMIVSLILMVMVSMATYRPATATTRLMDMNLEPQG